MKFKVAPETILKSIGIYEAKEINLELIAFSIGAEVKYKPLSSYEGSIVGTDTKAIITINESSDLQRRRFSLGHELGHWINDRGKNLTYQCSSSDMNQRNLIKNNYRQNREVIANKFSAELLMPKFILHQLSNDKKINIDTIKYLANEFKTSLNSTAIRLVETSDKPCMLITWTKDGKRASFCRSNLVPKSVWPHEKINDMQNFKPSCDLEVDADKWINSKNAQNYTLIESVFYNGFNHFSLLWWKSEAHFNDFNIHT